MLIKVVDGVPNDYSIARLRADNPNVSFPKTISETVLAEYDVYKVVEQVEPEIDPTTHKVVVKGIENIDGVWTQTVEVVPLTEEEIQIAFDARIQFFKNIVSEYLDQAVIEKGYDNIVSACSYAGYPNEYQLEAQAAIEFRASVWSMCYTILDDVKNKVRTEPTEEELLNELPTIVWP